MYFVSMWLVVNKVWDTSELVSGLNTCIQYSVMCWCYLKRGTISTISLECYFSLIRTKPCNPCTRRVHSVYTAYTLNEGRTNDYCLAFRATLLTVPHVRYTSYLATVPPRRAAGSPHVAREVKLYLIRTWGSVSKTRKKENAYIYCI
jgi:hypothetical protein